MRSILVRASRSSALRRGLGLLVAALVIPACGKSHGGVLIPPNPGTLEFIAAVFSATENGGSATITVRRSGGSLGAVGVSFGTADGSAVAPGDYTATSGTLAWADGDSADKTFNVPVINDVLVEGDETIALTLSLPSGGAQLGSQSAAVLTIVDNDAPAAGTLQFSSPTYSVIEDAGTATITVTRTGGSAGAVSVNVTNPAGGTATGGGTDYTFTPATLNWAAGDAAPKTFTVAIVNDASVEASETINLQLGGATGGAVVGTTGAAVLTIVDNDSAGTLSFSAPTYTVSESGVTATITVTRSGGAGGAVGVTYATSNGSATAGADYAAATGTLSWGSGDTSAKTFTVTILDDTAVEGNETVTLTLSAATGGATIGGTNPATLTIQDDDCTLQFSSPTFSLGEAGGTASVTVSRVGSSVGAVSVDFATAAGGTATGGGTDYTITPGTLTWAAGDSASKTISIPVAVDALPEGDETVNLVISNAAGVGAHLGTQTTAVFTIVDDDCTFQFSASTYTVGEAGGAATITVKRVGASAGIATVDWLISGGTATGGGTDYTAAPGTITWPAGDTADRTITITITSDTLAEGDETVLLALSNPTRVGGGASLGTPNTATLTITDDDVNLAFSAATYNTNENVTPVTVTVNRTGLTTGACSVTWGIAGGSTATGGGVDYTAAPGVLNWAAGDAAPKTFTITIVNDLLVEGPETILLTLSAPTGATLGAQNTATVNIVDDDAPGTLGYTSPTFTAGEAAGTVQVTVSRTLGVGGTVSATWHITGGTATAGGTDYDTNPAGQTSGVLTWTPGDAANKSISIVINDDLLVDPAETITFTLDTFTGGATGGQASATLTITDNDVPGTLGYTAPAFAFAESAGTVQVTVSRTGGVGGTVSATWHITGGTATAGGTDYDTVPPAQTSGVLTWTPGDATNKSIAIAINDDLLVDAGETITFTLDTFTGGASGGQASTTLTITDNDVAGTLGYTAPAFTFAESAGTVQVTVSRTGGVGNTVTATWHITGGSATAGGTDYDTVPPGQTSGVLTWAPGDAANKSISIAINDDVLFDPNETITFTLDTFTGGATGGQASSTLTITDNDIPGTLGYTNPTFTFGEAAGTVLVTVSRTGGSSGTVTATWHITGGTATAGGTDYDTNPAAQTSGVLTWTNGDAANKSIAIVINDDILVEAGETITFTLDTLTGGATAGQASTTLTITDNDNPGTLGYTSSTFTFGEAAGTVQVTVGRTVGTAGTVSATWHITGGTATAGGTDYDTNPAAQTSGVLTWTNGDAANKSISIVINNDVLGETNETITFTLDTPTGGAAIGTAAATMTITDNDAVTVISTVPTAGATNVLLDSDMVITFSQAMNKPVTEGAITITRAPLSSPLPSPVYVWSAGDTVLRIIFDTVAPSGALADIHGDDLLHDGTTYTVTVGTGAQSATGASVAAPVPLNFSTVPDATFPTIVSITPDPTIPIPSGTTQITITFSEPMSAAFGQAELFGKTVDASDQVGGGAGSGGMTLTWFSSTQLRITMAAPLPDGEGMDMSIAQVRDAAGNQVDEFPDIPMIVAKAGADTVAPFVTGTVPEAGAASVNRDGIIGVVFSESLRPDIVNKVTVSGTATAGVSYDIRYGAGDPPNLGIFPKKAWGTGTITVTIDCSAATGVKDAKGNALTANSGSNYVFTVTTVAGTALDMVIDDPYSSLKNAMTDIDPVIIDGYLRFKYNGTSTRAWPNRQTEAPQDFTLLDTTTNLPVKGMQIDTSHVLSEVGGIRFMRNVNQHISALNFSRTYSLTLNSSLKNSRDVAFTPATYTFTTRPNAGNAAVLISDPPEIEIDSVGGTAVGAFLYVGAMNFGAGAAETTSIKAENLAGGNSFTQTQTSPGGFNFFNFAYETITPPEAGIVTTGDFPFTFTATDSVGHSNVVLGKGYKFAASETNANLTTPPAVTTATPTYTWNWPTGVPASAQFQIVHVEDGGGNTIYEAFVSRTATTFTQPADHALTTGSYTVSIGVAHWEDGIITFGVISMGMGAPRAFSVP